MLPLAALLANKILVVHGGLGALYQCTPYNTSRCCRKSTTGDGQWLIRELFSMFRPSKAAFQARS
jgi:hypothetical protein